MGNTASMPYVSENMEFCFLTTFSLHYSEIGCSDKIGKFVSFLHFISKKSKKLFLSLLHSNLSPSLLLLLSYLRELIPGVIRSDKG